MRKTGCKRAQQSVAHGLASSQVNAALRLSNSAETPGGWKGRPSLGSAALPEQCIGAPGEAGHVDASEERVVGDAQGYVDFV